ncbi:hypothetical protein UFOVP816_16 [uncultured Caudovirales phage]|uniref:Uncharacterized protein n=1 Tax=uncultured Caudovirales phage TaxID=2100421 RepID=A0A6J5NXR4_9CAUD|nr:hypothetical protein UFOVP816_16 [uncultured Caudovirales phage]
MNDYEIEVLETESEVLRKKIMKMFTLDKADKLAGTVALCHALGSILADLEDHETPIGLSLMVKLIISAKIQTLEQKDNE